MTVIWIKLEIEGDEDDDAMGVVDDALDNGCMQDALVEYASDNGKDLGEITSVLAVFTPPTPDAEMCRVCGRDDKTQCGARCREEVRS